MKKPSGRNPIKFNQLFLYFIPAVLWMGLITVLTLLPSHKIPKDLDGANDKIIHVGIYFISNSLIYLGFIRYSFRKPLAQQILVRVALACMAYGALIEVLQQYLPISRQGDWYDFLANTVGIAISVVFINLSHRWS